MLAIPAGAWRSQAGPVGDGVDRGRARGLPGTPPVVALRTWRLMRMLRLGRRKRGLTSRRPIAGYLASCNRSTIDACARRGQQRSPASTRHRESTGNRRPACPAAESCRHRSSASRSNGTWFTSDHTCPCWTRRAGFANASFQAGAGFESGDLLCRTSVNHQIVDGTAFGPQC